MANSEYKSQQLYRQTCSEEPPSCIDVFSSTSSSFQRSIDRSLEHSQYIDVDLTASSQWDRMTRGRRLPKSLDSQEFEFSMHGFAQDLLEPAQVAPADELFFKGQLLPLQPDTRLHLVQSLCSHEGVLQSEICSRIDQDVKFSSCRIDAVTLDSSVLELRCSSFRSQSSSYWESGDKETGDSSSSRDSNGSSQDSYFSGDKEVSKRSAAGQAPRSSANQWRRRSAFNWKSIFGGMKRASKMDQWVDERASQSACNSGRQIVSGSSSSTNLCKQKPLVISSSAGRDGSGSSGGGLKRVSSTSKARDGSMEVGLSHSDAGKGRTEKQKVEKEVRHRSGWHSKERWQAYAKKLKPLYTKVNNNTQKSEVRRGGLLGQLRMDDCGKGGCAILPSAATTNSCTNITTTTSPLIESCKLSQSSLLANLQNNLGSSSSRFLTIASCPPSMLSSPNHSGVLAVINKSTSTSAPHDIGVSNHQHIVSSNNGSSQKSNANVSHKSYLVGFSSNSVLAKSNVHSKPPGIINAPSISSMQELHSAVQGAIAHCKESIAGKPAISSSSSSIEEPPITSSLSHR